MTSPKRYAVGDHAVLVALAPARSEVVKVMALFDEGRDFDYGIKVLSTGAELMVTERELLPWKA